MLLLVLDKTGQVFREIRLPNLIIESKEDLMQYFDFFFDCPVGPQFGQMVPFHIHEGPHLAVRLLLEDHVLHDVLLEMWVLEDLVLGLCEEENEQEGHVNVVLLHQAKTVHENDVELHWLLRLVLLFRWCATLVVHD